MLQQLLQTSAWQTYQQSWLPFFVPLSIWTIAWIFAKQLSGTGKSFEKWTTIHNIHNIGGMIIGAVSLFYFNNHHLIDERVGILYSLSYFLVDLLDCLYRRDAAYTLHATCCLILGVCNYKNIGKIMRPLRMNSKAIFMEASTPFMHLSQKTRKPLHFIMFALVFTICRIVWVPMIFKQVIEYKENSDGAIFYIVPTALALFYALNLFWWSKIVRILINGGERPVKSTTKDSGSSNDGSSVKRKRIVKPRKEE